MIGFFKCAKMPQFAENSNPMVVQSKIRQNTAELQSFLQDMGNWSTEMKAKEIANSDVELKVLNYRLTSKPIRMIHRNRYTIYNDFN